MTAIKLDQNVTRPCLRYHGGKWKLAPWIISHFPTHRVYVEPFGGGASVLLRKERSYAEIYNDLDGEIVNVFRMVRDHGRKLKEQLFHTPFARDEFELAYEQSDDPLEQARRTIARSFMGFGSAAATQGGNRRAGASTGFRANSNRSGTTPSHDWKSYAEKFDQLIERLRGVVIENRDAIEVMHRHDSAQTLHYVDPPYVLSSRDDNRPDYRFEMTDAAHEELAHCLKSLTGMVVLSGYETSLYDRLYGDWKRVERKAFADGAKERTEILWLSPGLDDIAAARHPELFDEVMA